MQQFATLLATYRATLKANRPWSASKDNFLNYIAQDYGSLPISHITPTRLKAWATSSPRSKTVKRQMLVFLIDVCQFGQRWANLNIDVRSLRDTVNMLIEFGIVSTSRQRTRRVSDAEIAAIAACWTARTPSAALYILRDTAMRSGELCALHWHDVDLTNRIAYLRQRKSRGGMKIPIFGNLSHWAHMPKTTDRVCPSTQACLSQAFRRAARLAGVRDIVLHDLRHEGTSRLAELGLSVAQMQAVTGHKSVSALERYTHVTPQAVARLAHQTNRLH